MKLIEAETTGPGEETDVEPPPRPRPPRPEKRRVSVSLVLTLLVLVGTVVAVYLLVPARHNALIETGLRLHREDDPDLELARPSEAELVAWGVAVLGKDVPWPRPGGDLSVEGVQTTSVLNWRAAVIRYRIGDDRVTLLAQRNRTAVPRTTHRRDGDLLAVSWRHKKWTFVAVGPADHFDRWGPRVEAPR